MWAIATSSSGDDRRVGPHGGDDGFGADRERLLVGDRGDDYVAREVAPKPGCGEHDRRQAALHVVRAAAVETRPVDARRHAGVFAAQCDGVEVSVQEQRPPSPAAADAADDVGAAAGELVVLGVDAAAVEPGGHEAGDLGLARPTGNQRRIDGVDPDELLDELPDRSGCGCSSHYEGVAVASRSAGVTSSEGSPLP